MLAIRATRRPFGPRRPSIGDTTPGHWWAFLAHQRSQRYHGLSSGCCKSNPADAAVEAPLRAAAFGAAGGPPPSPGWAHRLVWHEPGVPAAFNRTSGIGSA